MTSAVVIGGGLTGMFAAAAAAPYVDAVTVIEDDELPDAPRPRRGLPQGHHNHMLMRGGVEAFDRLLPGVVDDLYAVGAKRRGMPGDLLVLTGEGWYERHRGDAYIVALSRDLLDHVVRRRVLNSSTITVRERTRATGLAGNAGRVTGVRVRSGTDPEEIVTADLVIDATGRRSAAPRWLTELGLPEVRQEVVDAGFAYAGRKYQAPAGTRDDFPGVLMQAKPGTAEPACGAALLPNEGDRWVVALIGSRGGHPPTDEAGFMRFARDLPHSVIADLIEQATPLTEIRAYRGMANRRRRYEKLPVPEGFVVLGDAAQVLNPNYATGMSVAALDALVLREHLAGHGLRPGLSRRVQSGVAKVKAGPWQLATAADHWFPGVETNIKPMGGRSALRFSARYTRTAATDAALCNATFSAAALTVSPMAMMRLPLLLSVLRGPRRAPLNANEAIAAYPEFDTLLANFPDTVGSGAVAPHVG